MNRAEVTSSSKTARHIILTGADENPDSQKKHKLRTKLCRVVTTNSCSKTEHLEHISYNAPKLIVIRSIENRLRRDPCIVTMVFQKSSAITALAIGVVAYICNISNGAVDSSSVTSLVHV